MPLRIALACLLDWSPCCRLERYRVHMVAHGCKDEEPPKQLRHALHVYIQPGAGPEPRRMRTKISGSMPPGDHAQMDVLPEILSHRSASPAQTPGSGRPLSAKFSRASLFVAAADKDL